MEAVALQGNSEGTLRILEDLDIGFRSATSFVPVGAAVILLREAEHKNLSRPAPPVAVPSLATARS
jgi:hypothetical protein